MKVSVLIPLYNAEKYIARTLESVIRQTYKDFEIVVIDDCGTDSSVDIVKEFQKKDSRIKIIHNDNNRGIAYSRNRGIDLSEGKYIALLDDDDVMTERRLEWQVKYLDENQNIGAVGGNAQWIDENDKIIRDTISVITNPVQMKMFLNFRNIFNNSEMTFRKLIVTENALDFQNHSLGMEDYRFWIDFSHVSQISNLHQLVLKKRIINTNETFKMRTEKAEARKNKYVELQCYALRKNGFIIDEYIEKNLAKYMGEEPRVCSDYVELSELVGLLGKLTDQAYRLKLDIAEYMVSWFHSIIVTQNNNVIEALNGEKKVDYWENKCNEMGKYIADLLKGKEWLEKHSKDQEAYIADLLKGKEWLEKHSKDQEAYIADLLKGKEWLEKHSKDQEAYIAELKKR